MIKTPIIQRCKSDKRNFLERFSENWWEINGSGIVGCRLILGLPRWPKFLKIKVVMINGKHLERLEQFLNNKPFVWKQ